MLKYNFFFSFSFFIIFTTFSSAESKISFIDLDLVLSKSKPGILLFSQFKDLELKKLKDLKLQEDVLKNDEKQILSSKNIITKDEFNKNINDFKIKVKEYQITRVKTLENLKEKRNKEILRFLNLVNPLIQNIMNERSIEILLEKKNIFVAKSDYDITSIVIETINKNITNFVIE